MATEGTKLIGDKPPTRPEPENKANKKITVSEWIDGQKFGPFYVVLMICVSFGSMSEAVTVLLAGYISAAIRCDWNLSQVQLAIFNAAIFIGYLVGCCFWGYLSDRFGRRRVIVLTIGMVAYYSILSGMVPTLPWATGIRFVLGLSVAGITNAAVYFVEIVPERYRAAGFLVTLAFWSVGTIVEAVMSMVLLERRNGWRILTVLTAALPILLCTTIFVFPESPLYLAVMGHKNKAIKAMNKLARINQSPKPNIEDIDFIVEKPRVVEVRQMLKKKIIIVSILVSLTGFCISFLYFGNTIYTLELIERSGIVKHKIRDQSCFETCAQLTREDYINVMIASSAELPGAIIAIVLAVYFPGRRILIVGGMACCACTALLMIGSSFAWVNLLLLFLTRGTGFLLYNTYIVFSLERFPTSIRAKGIATANLFSRLGSILTPLVAQVVMPYSARLGLLLYAVASLMVSLLIFFCRESISEKDIEEE